MLNRASKRRPSCWYAASEALLLLRLDVDDDNEVEEGSTIALLLCTTTIRAGVPLKKLPECSTCCRPRGLHLRWCLESRRCWKEPLVLNLLSLFWVCRLRDFYGWLLQSYVLRSSSSIKHHEQKWYLHCPLVFVVNKYVGRGGRHRQRIYKELLSNHLVPIIMLILGTTTDLYGPTKLLCLQASMLLYNTCEQHAKSFSFLCSQGIEPNYTIRARRGRRKEGGGSSRRISICVQFLPVSGYEKPIEK